MAEILEPEQPRKKCIGPEVEQIVEDIENRAHILHESGRLEDAANLREWAGELRQKSIQKPF